MHNKLPDYINIIKVFIDRKLKLAVRWVDIRGNARLRTNVILFGISLFISVLIWAFVAWNGNIDGTRTMSVQVEYLNLQRGYSMFESTRKVSISLVGRINVLSRVRDTDVSARVELQGLQPGKYSLPVKIEVPAYAKIKSWQPSTVDVEIYRHVERTIPITWSVNGVLPEGMMISSVDIKPFEAILSGPESEVLAVQSLEVVIPSEKISIEDSLFLPVTFTKDSINKERVTITPKMAVIKVLLEQEILGERIPLKVSVVGQPADGLELDSIRVIPEHVTIKGRSEAVKKITSLVLPPIDISGLDQNINLMLPIQPAEISPEVEISGPDRARVEISVRKKISTKTYSNVAIMTEGGNSGKEWKISPQSAKITIEGPQLAIEALQAGTVPCELYVNVMNIVSKQLSLPVLVKNLKKDFHLVRIEPEQVVVTSVD